MVAKLFTLYSAGFLVSLTPCVFPLIPVTVGIIDYASGNEKNKRAKVILYSIAYIFGILIMFTALGLIGVAFGKTIEGYLQHYITKIIFGNLFIIFGFMYFGTLSFPHFNINSKVKPNSIFSVFVLGIVTSLALGPCSGPALTAVLTDVVQTKSYFLGGLYLFVYGVGLSTILFLASIFSSIITFIRKSSGNWMNYVKYAIGIALITAGEYYIIEAGKLMAFL